MLFKYPFHALCICAESAVRYRCSADFKAVQIFIHRLFAMAVIAGLGKVSEIPGSLMDLKEIIDGDQLGIFGAVLQSSFKIIPECIVIADPLTDTGDAAVFRQIDPPHTAAVGIADLIHQIDFLLIGKFFICHKCLPFLFQHSTAAIRRCYTFRNTRMRGDLFRRCNYARMYRYCSINGVTLMSAKTVSTLSRKHIFISILLIVCIRLLAIVINLFANQEGIALMAAMNLCTGLLIVYNWPLIDRHCKRTLGAIGDSLLFTAIGIVSIGILTWLSITFLKADVLLPEPQLLIGVGYARPGMLIAFSIMEACMVSIGFKNMTDHLDVRNKELQAILISAIVSGLFMTVLFTNPELFMMIRTLPYWLLLTMILSYLYNQCHSIIPGIVALTVVNLAFMILSII